MKSARCRWKRRTRSCACWKNARLSGWAAPRRGRRRRALSPRRAATWRRWYRPVVFRAELYSRLQLFALYIPPLREHKEDIPALVEFFKNRMAAYLDREPVSLSSEVMEMLQAYDWPGNVRELEHFIQRVVIACKRFQIGTTDLMQCGFDLADSTLGLKGRASSRFPRPRNNATA